MQGYRIKLFQMINDLRTEIFGRQPQTFSVIETASFGIVFNADAIIETINESGVKKYEDSN